MNDAGHIDVRHVADLARLNLTEEEAELFGRQLDQVLDYVSQLEEAEVAHVEPTAHAVPVQDVLREDEPCCGLDRDVILANAPAVRGKQFVVPRMVE